MNPQFEELDVSFSTADVTGLDVSYSDRALVLVITDWRGDKTSVLFRNVAAYKWDESSFSHIDAKPDRVYRVHDSEWLKRWAPSVDLTHFMLGFCGTPSCGYLEVIARSMEPQKPNQALEPTPMSVTPPAAQEPRRP